MDSYEHQETGKTATFSPIAGTANQNSWKQTTSFRLSIGTGLPLSLTYGEAVALAGDFFVSYDSLMQCDSKMISVILSGGVYKKDDAFDIVWLLDGTKQAGSQISFYYLAGNNPEHFRGPPLLNLPSTAGDGIGAYLSPSSSYLINTGVLNSAYDSTALPGPDAIATYSAGHGLALQYAAQAQAYQTKANPASGQGYDIIAYTINAFYDHYLTDMFSSGHIRVPRRYLHDQSSNLGTDAPLVDLFTARLMHNEDSAVGLWVTNPNASPSVWYACGDGYELTPVPLSDGGTITPDGNGNAQCEHVKNGLDPGNVANWNAALSAVQASVSEVTTAISSQAVPQGTYAALAYRPDPFPPGAPVYPNSTINQYTVKMVATGGTISAPFLVNKTPSDQQALLVPGWPWTTKGWGPGGAPGNDNLVSAPPWFLRWVLGFDNGPSWWPAQSKKFVSLTLPTYCIQTTGGAQQAGQLGTQTYPLYLLANDATPSNSYPIGAVLYVRAISQNYSKNVYGDASYGQDVLYVMAEYNAKNPSTLPQLGACLRLSGQCNGYPLPQKPSGTSSGGS